MMNPLKPLLSIISDQFVFSPQLISLDPMISLPFQSNLAAVSFKLQSFAAVKLVPTLPYQLIMHINSLSQSEAQLATDTSFLFKSLLAHLHSNNLIAICNGFIKNSPDKSSPTEVDCVVLSVGATSGLMYSFPQNSLALVEAIPLATAVQEYNHPSAATLTTGKRNLLRSQSFKDSSCIAPSLVSERLEIDGTSTSTSSRPGSLGQNSSVHRHWLKAYVVHKDEESLVDCHISSPSSSGNSKDYDGTPGQDLCPLEYSHSAISSNQLHTSLVSNTTSRGLFSSVMQGSTSLSLQSSNTPTVAFASPVLPVASVSPSIDMPAGNSHQSVPSGSTGSGAGSFRVLRSAARLQVPVVNIFESMSQQEPVEDVSCGTIQSDLPATNDSDTISASDIAISTSDITISTSDITINTSDIAINTSDITIGNSDIAICLNTSQEIPLLHEKTEEISFLKQTREIFQNVVKSKSLVSILCGCMLEQKLTPYYASRLILEKLSKKPKSHKFKNATISSLIKIIYLKNLTGAETDPIVPSLSYSLCAASILLVFLLLHDSFQKDISVRQKFSVVTALNRVSVYLGAGDTHISGSESLYLIHSSCILSRSTSLQDFHALLEAENSTQQTMPIGCDDTGEIDILLFKLALQENSFSGLDKNSHEDTLHVSYESGLERLNIQCLIDIIIARYSKTNIDALNLYPVFVEYTDALINDSDVEMTKSDVTDNSIVIRKRKFSLGNKDEDSTIEIENEKKIDVELPKEATASKSRNSLLSTRKLAGHRTEMIEKFEKNKLLPVTTLVPAALQVMKHKSSTHSQLRKPLVSLASTHNSNRLDFNNSKDSKIHQNVKSASMNKEKCSEPQSHSRGHKSLRTSVIQETPNHKLSQAFNRKENVKLFQSHIFGLKATDTLFDE